MATSTTQTIPLTEVYDYVLATGDPSSATTAKGLAGQKVKVTLNYDRALTIAPDVVVWVPAQTVYTAVTDGNGFWHVFLVPNNKISPANTFYTVEVEGKLNYQIQVTDVAVPAPGWQSSAPSILLNIPAALAPTTSTVGAITATGLITAQAGINVSAGGVTVAGGLTVSGGETETGGLTVDTLSYSSAVSRLIPGATSFSVRDTGNANDNLLVSNAGNVTVRGSLTVTGGGFTLTAGNLTITAGALIFGAASSVVIPGATALSFNNNANNATNLQILDAGSVAIRNGLTITAGGETITAGNLTITAGNLTFGAAASQIVPGATSISLRNNANNADNLLIADAGLATFRNAVQVPPSAGAALPGLPNASSPTIPVKLDDQSTASAASLTLTVPAGPLYRTLVVYLTGRSDQASGQVVALQFNADTGANYDYGVLLLTNASVAGGTPGIAVTSGRCGSLDASGATAGAVGGSSITIENADSTTLRKTWTWTGGRFDTDAAANTNWESGFGQWRNTANAITSIKLIPAAGNLVNARAILFGYA